MWRHTPRGLPTLIVVGVVLQLTGLTFILVDVMRSGWEPWAVFMLVAVPFNVVLMSLVLWSFHARYTEADAHRLRHHEPVARSRSFDLPWDRIADIRKRGGVLTGTAWVIGDDGREYPMASVPVGGTEELRDWWLSHRGDGGAVDGPPSVVT